MSYRDYKAIIIEFHGKKVKDRERTDLKQEDTNLAFSYQITQTVDKEDYRAFVIPKVSIWDRSFRPVLADNVEYRRILPVYMVEWRCSD